MPREERFLNEEFAKYQKFIVQHPNYATLPNKTNAKNDITWVKQGNVERAKWWDDQKNELGLKDRASVARSIHPKELNGFKPCQVCGRKMSIYPIYPNKNALKKINSRFKILQFQHFQEDITTIVEQVMKNYGDKALSTLANIFSIDTNEKNIQAVTQRIIDEGRFLSPGVMSNAPDRLDGFHSYNSCCRSTQDTGRHASNLARYSTDRRAYENWADGDWRGADRLMGLYKKEQKKVPCPRCGVLAKMTADHVGPISLGFMHRMDFKPLCKSCNSSKNNRISFEEIQQLIALENGGVPVVSWHASMIWEALKPLISDDASALRASVLMRRNMHHVLLVLSILKDAGFEEFLKSYLHPEYASFDFKFLNFDPSTGYFEFERYAVDSANTRKLAQRYLRISFEALDEYSQVENRKAKIWNNPTCDKLLHEIKAQIITGNLSKAKLQILEFLEELADVAVNEF